jgi:hypothetical protein
MFPLPLRTIRIFPLSSPQFRWPLRFLFCILHWFCVRVNWLASLSVLVSIQGPDRPWTRVFRHLPLSISLLLLDSHYILLVTISVSDCETDNRIRKHNRHRSGLTLQHCDRILHTKVYGSATGLLTPTRRFTGHRICPRLIYVTEIWDRQGWKRQGKVQWRIWVFYTGTTAQRSSSPNDTRRYFITRTSIQFRVQVTLLTLGYALYCSPREPE